METHEHPTLLRCIEMATAARSWMPGAGYVVIRTAEGGFVWCELGEEWPAGTFIARVMPAGDLAPHRGSDGASTRGRKKQYESPAEKQRAYRERKAAKDAGGAAREEQLQRQVQELTEQVQRLESAVGGVLLAAAGCQYRGLAMGIDSHAHWTHRATQLAAFLASYRPGPQPTSGAGAGYPRAGAQRDPYELLGIQRGADRAAIKRAYLNRSAQLHPDKVKGAGLAPELISAAEELFKALQQTYSQLS